jgi:N-methylhydantoinase A
MASRLGVDIGGTFTDFTLVDRERGVILWKEESTPDDPARALRTGLAALARGLGLTQAQFLARTALLVHGTTIATNTVIQRNGPRIGLLCTRGFRDVLYFRDGFKPERFNVHLPHPEDFAERYLRLGVTERITADGRILTPLDEDDVRRAARQLREVGVEAVAVAFLWSVVNSEHEQRAAEIVSEELPGAEVVCSSDILPEIREWERTSATVLSAYVRPGISSYLQRLETSLHEAGLERAPLIMQINGGCASVAEILRRPVNALASGPAAAPAAAGFFSSQLGINDVITVDMGGTSFDVCVIREGRPAMSRTIQVESQPVGVPGVEVHSVGAGGGSIAWIDSGGALRVGPRSAGARPGPACYATGGTEPTVTDANVVLGYLSPDAFLGGRRPLDARLADTAVEDKVAEPLGLDVTSAAAGIVRVVNANMVGAIRAVSIERGIDPRGFALVVGGGAGALHATRLARELGITTVLIPYQASTFCAFGMTVTDVRHDHSRPLHALSTTIDLAAVDAVYNDLERQATERLRGDGFADEQIILERLVDARYPGQVHEITIPVPLREAYSEADAREIEGVFHREHERQFTYARRDLPVEFLHWRVSAIGRMPPPGWADGNGKAPQESDALLETRQAYSHEAAGLVSTPVYAIEGLATGSQVAGPAVLQAETTTILLDEGDRLRVGEGAYIVDVPAG